MIMELSGKGVEQTSATPGALQVPGVLPEVRDVEGEITVPAIGEVVPHPVAYAVDRPTGPADMATAAPETTAITQAERTADIEQWRALPVRQLDWRRPLKPFTIVEGVMDFRSFNAIEKAIVGKISPRTIREGLDAAYGREPIISRDHIGDTFRPKGPPGVLHHGQALILPFSAERTLAHNPRLAPVIPSDPEALKRSFGVLYTGLFKPAKGEMAQLVLDASYFPRPVRPARSNDDGYVHRALSKVAYTALSARQEDAAMEDIMKHARAVARAALKSLERPQNEP